MHKSLVKRKSINTEWNSPNTKSLLSKKYGFLQTGGCAPSERLPSFSTVPLNACLLLFQLSMQEFYDTVDWPWEEN